MAVLLNASESISVKTNFLDKLVLIFVCCSPLQRRSDGVEPERVEHRGVEAAVASSIRPMPSNRHQKAQGNPNASALSRTSRT